MDTKNNNDAALEEKLSFDNFRNEVLKDYQYACESRETSLLGRKEVDRKSTRLNSSHLRLSRMPSSA